MGQGSVFQKGRPGAFQLEVRSWHREQEWETEGPGPRLRKQWRAGLQAGLGEPPGSGHISAGEYESIFEAQGFRWRLRQLVKVPLQEEEVVRLPDALSISCTASTGFQLSCCIPLTTDYTATWSPGEDSQGRTLSETSDEAGPSRQHRLPFWMGVGQPCPSEQSLLC